MRAKRVRVIEIVALGLAILACFLAAISVSTAYGQGFPLQNGFCAEWGIVEDASMYKWEDMYSGALQLTDDGVSMVSALEASEPFQAHYGDHSTDDDDYWIVPYLDGTWAQIPDGLENAYVIKVTTSASDERRIYFSHSEEDPDRYYGWAFNTMKVSGEGDQYGAHDICAMLILSTEDIEAIFNETIVPVE